MEDNETASCPLCQTSSYFSLFLSNLASPLLRFLLLAEERACRLAPQSTPRRTLWLLTGVVRRSRIRHRTVDKSRHAEPVSLCVLKTREASGDEELQTVREVKASRKGRAARSSERRTNQSIDVSLRHYTDVTY